MAAENDHDIPLSKVYCARSLIPIRKTEWPLEKRVKWLQTGCCPNSGRGVLIWKGECPDLKMCPVRLN
jgi:hypothetical protein